MSMSYGLDQIGTSIHGLNADENLGRKGTIALSQDGKTLAVGSIDPNSNTGVVRIYDLINNAWVERSNSIYGDGEEIGGSVSISDDGNTIAVSSYNHLAVAIYDWDGVKNSWAQRGEDIQGVVDETYSGAGSETVEGGAGNETQI